MLPIDKYEWQEAPKLQPLFMRSKSLTKNMNGVGSSHEPNLSMFVGYQEPIRHRATVMIGALPNIIKRRQTVIQNIEFKIEKK